MIVFRDYFKTTQFQFTSTYGFIRAHFLLVSDLINYSPLFYTVLKTY
jgi:hypothetical protein